MKKIFFLIVVLCVSFVSADMQVGIDLNSGGGDMSSYIYHNTEGGNLDLYIDGYNMKDQMDSFNQKISDSERSMCSIQNNIANIFVTKGGYGNGKYYIPEWIDLNYCEAELRNSVEQYMLQSVINHYEARLQQMELQIKMLQTQFSETELCNMKIQVAREINIKEVKCGKINYYLDGDKIIKLEDIEEPVIVNDKVITSQPERLCEKGFTWFCNNHSSLISINGTICPMNQLENGKCMEVIE